MRRSAALVMFALLASCGPKPVTLPADPVDRAAACGVVAAAGARNADAAAVAKPLTLAQSAHVLHYPMLAASAGGSFDHKVAAAGVARMTALEPGITAGRWQPLVAACVAAFPKAQGDDRVTLPTDRLDAELGCSALGDYLSRAMASQEAAYGEQLFVYRQLGTRLDAGIAALLAARGVKGFAAVQRARAKALAIAVNLGPPAAVMDACLVRYPPSKS